MGLHGCNKLCNLHPAMHYAQRELLELEGGHDPDDREKLKAALEVRLKETQEMLELL